MSSNTEGSGGRPSLNIHAGPNQFASSSEGEASGGHYASHINTACTDDLSKKVRRYSSIRASIFWETCACDATLPRIDIANRSCQCEPICKEFGCELLTQTSRLLRTEVHHVPGNTDQRKWHLPALLHSLLNEYLVVMQACTTCGATDTPMWRNGACGPKTLCNACGEQCRLQGAAFPPGFLRTAQLRPQHRLCLFKLAVGVQCEVLTIRPACNLSVQQLPRALLGAAIVQESSISGTYTKRNSQRKQIGIQSWQCQAALKTAC